MCGSNPWKIGHDVGLAMRLYSSTACFEARHHLGALRPICHEGHNQDHDRARDQGWGQDYGQDRIRNKGKTRTRANNKTRF